MRERGLKFIISVASASVSAVAPVRERGLKYELLDTMEVHVPSLP